MNEIWMSDTCGWCVKAKELMDAHGFKYTVRDALEEQEEFMMLFPEARTVPQIIFQDEHVGGYDGLVEAFNNKNIFVGGSSII